MYVGSFRAQRRHNVTVTVSSNCFVCDFRLHAVPHCSSFTRIALRVPRKHQSLVSYLGGTYFNLLISKVVRRGDVRKKNSPTREYFQAFSHKFLRSSIPHKKKLRRRFHSATFQGLPHFRPGPPRPSDRKAVEGLSEGHGRHQVAVASHSPSDFKAGKMLPVHRLSRS